MLARSRHLRQKVTEEHLKELLNTVAKRRKRRRLWLAGGRQAGMAMMTMCLICAFRLNPIR
jgi:hypothetical protein